MTTRSRPGRPPSRRASLPRSCHWSWLIRSPDRVSCGHGGPVSSSRDSRSPGPCAGPRSLWAPPRSSSSRTPDRPSADIPDRLERPQAGARAPLPAAVRRHPAADHARDPRGGLPARRRPRRVGRPGRVRARTTSGSADAATPPSSSRLDGRGPTRRGRPRHRRRRRHLVTDEVIDMAREFTAAQRVALDQAIRAAEQVSRCEFSVFVGTAEGDAAARSPSGCTRRCRRPQRSVLIMVDPVGPADRGRHRLRGTPRAQRPRGRARRARDAHRVRRRRPGARPAPRHHHARRWPRAPRAPCTRSA